MSQLTPVQSDRLAERRTRFFRPSFVVQLGLLVCLILGPLVVPSFRFMDVVTKIMIFTVVVASFDLILGYTGKQLIHPNQVPLVHTVYTPSDEEIAHAERVVQAHERQQQSGAGAFALDGKMDADPAGSLESLPWVSEVSKVGNTTWDVAVSDRTIAENELLAALAGQHGSAVTEFRPLVQSLEDIYMAAVDADNSRKAGHDD